MNQKKTNGLGIAAMILGIIAFLLSCCGAGGLLGIVGLILGIVGLTQKDKGKGMATTGVVLSSIAILISLFTISNGGLPEYIQKSREASQNSSQQIEGTADDTVNATDDTATENGPEITLDEFNQIETGMTYDEVATIIGSDGTLSSESTFNDTTTQLYIWYGKNGIANANFTFQNDSLISKAQLGLD